jgi:hypothetical protein
VFGSRDRSLKRNLPPVFIDPHRAGFVQEIETVTAPAPLLGQIDESALHRIAMHIPQLFDALLRRPHVEIASITTGDKVQVIGAVSAMQTPGHDKAAAVYLLTLTTK